MDISNEQILGTTVEAALAQLRASGDSCMTLQSPDLDGGDPVVVIVARKSSVGPAHALASQMANPMRTLTREELRPAIELPFGDTAVVSLERRRALRDAGNRVVERSLQAIGVVS